jgi:predicted RNA-binding protein YlxR (DUF448 family)
MKKRMQSGHKSVGERPARTCVGCHERIVATDRDPSIRFVLGLADGEGGAHGVAVDLAGGSFGRGAHVHATATCLAKACAGGFAKAFRCRVKVELDGLTKDLAEAASRRIDGLLLGARRAGYLAFGEEARGSGADTTPLFLVARDAGPSATGGPLRQAIADGRVLAWGTKESLGNLFSRELVAVVAVRHESVAREISRTHNLYAGAPARDSVQSERGAGRG